NRARWIQWIVPGWNLRFAFVTSLALLLLGAWFGLMINRHKPPHDPNSNRAGVRQGGDNQAKLPSGKAPDDSASNDRQIAHDKSDRRGSTLKSIKPGLNESPQTEERMIEPDLIAQNLDTAEPATDPSMGPDPASVDLKAKREMLRIEFQTADPNIRIIWFAPKSDAAPTTPNTK